MRRCQAAASQPNRQAANVAHGALPYIGGARLAPGQLSFATLATAASLVAQAQHCCSSRRRRSTGRWFRQRRAAAHSARTLATSPGRAPTRHCLSCQGLAYSSERDFAASEFLR